MKGQESTYAYSLLVLTYDKGDDRIRDYYLVGSNTEVACDDVDPKDSVFDVTTMLREAEEEHVVIDWANDFGGVDLAVWTVEGGSGDKVEVEVFSGDEVSCVFDPERYPDDGTLAVDCDSTRYENARDDAQVIASGSVCVLRG